MIPADFTTQNLFTMFFVLIILLLALIGLLTLIVNAASYWGEK
jgi:CHASE3 domain sensor protein